MGRYQAMGMANAFDDDESDDDGGGSSSAANKAKSRRKSHQRPQGSDQVRQAFSKRKKGLVLKAYQLSALTDAKVFMFIVNDKGSSWAYATPGFAAALDPQLLKEMRSLAQVPDQAKLITEVMPDPPNAKQPDAFSMEQQAAIGSNDHLAAAGTSAATLQYSAAVPAHSRGSYSGASSAPDGQMFFDHADRSGMVRSGSTTSSQMHSQVDDLSPTRFQGWQPPANHTTTGHRQSVTSMTSQHHYGGPRSLEPSTPCGVYNLLGQPNVINESLRVGSSAAVGGITPLINQLQQTDSATPTAPVLNRAANIVYKGVAPQAVMPMQDPQQQWQRQQVAAMQQQAMRQQALQQQQQLATMQQQAQQQQQALQQQQQQHAQRCSQASWGAAPQQGVVPYQQQLLQQLPATIGLASFKVMGSDMMQQAGGHTQGGMYPIPAAVPQPGAAADSACEQAPVGVTPGLTTVPTVLPDAAANCSQQLQPGQETAGNFPPAAAAGAAAGAFKVAQQGLAPLDANQPPSDALTSGQDTFGSSSASAGAVDTLFGQQLQQRDNSSPELMALAASGQAGMQARGSAPGTPVSKVAQQISESADGSPTAALSRKLTMALSVGSPLRMSHMGQSEHQQLQQAEYFLPPLSLQDPLQLLQRQQQQPSQAQQQLSHQQRRLGAQGAGVDGASTRPEPPAANLPCPTSSLPLLSPGQHEGGMFMSGLLDDPLMFDLLDDLIASPTGDKAAVPPHQQQLPMQQQPGLHHQQQQVMQLSLKMQQPMQQQLVQAGQFPGSPMQAVQLPAMQQPLHATQALVDWQLAQQLQVQPQVQQQQQQQQQTVQASNLLQLIPPPPKNDTERVAWQERVKQLLGTLQPHQRQEFAALIRDKEQQASMAEASSVVTGRCVASMQHSSAVQGGSNSVSSSPRAGSSSSSEHGSGSVTAGYSPRKGQCGKQLHGPSRLSATCSNTPALVSIPAGVAFSDQSAIVYPQQSSPCAGSAMPGAAAAVGVREGVIPGWGGPAFSQAVPAAFNGAAVDGLRPYRPQMMAMCPEANDILAQQQQQQQDVYCTFTHGAALPAYGAIQNAIAAGHGAVGSMAGSAATAADSFGSPNRVVAVRGSAALGSSRCYSPLKRAPPDSIGSLAGVDTLSRCGSPLKRACKALDFKDPTVASANFQQLLQADADDSDDAVAWATLAAANISMRSSANLAGSCSSGPGLAMQR